MKNPARGRAFLTDPNYYRLGFQLAAQVLNRDLAPRRTGPPGDVRGQRRRARTPDPLEVADQVLADARSMVAWYDVRFARPRWRRLFSKVQPHERRLRAFLAETVEPCTHLLAAAVLRERDAGDSPAVEAHLAPVMDRAHRNELSYRAYYSLACWNARLGDTSNALADLYRALSMAPRDRSFDLSDWASIDPSLAGLRKPPAGGEFRALVKHFSRPNAAEARRAAT